MRQKLFTFLALFLLVFLLIGLNAVSYVRKDTEPDTEFNPNRSTFNSGATGTLAFFDLLAETGGKPVRWQEKISALDGNSKNKPQTFVVVGSLLKSFTDEETEQLLRWVSLGGRLVVIDRAPRADLISTTANWKISADAPAFADYNIDPSDQKSMTDRIAAGTPAQPTIFTNSVNAVQPSRFASSIKLEKVSADTEAEATGDAAEYLAPVIHISNGEKNLLADFRYGAGRIVFLSDPYIVSNAGISLVDNAQLAINIVNSNGGIIAFDEFHHAYGANQNQLSAYFAETPIPAIFLQAALLVGLLFLTQSRRFARPLPADEPSRLSKLEYVSAMAELQQRTKAYDLAIENIYTDFRRRAAKFFGAGNYEITRRELAALVAERLKLKADEIEDLMRKAEEITYGEPTNKREVLEITTRLRELEEKLGLKRTRKQVFGK